jgi:protein-S-isoprenylcysteine O-methyltransferase Ste14
VILQRLPQVVSAFGMFLAAAGCGWTVWTFWTLGLTRMLRRPVPPPALLLRGPYRLVRYPCCSGVIAFLLGWLLWDPRWIAAGSCAVTVAACLVWVMFQDHRRLVRFGEAYQRYCIAVPRLLPLRLRRRE